MSRSSDAFYDTFETPNDIESMTNHLELAEEANHASDRRKIALLEQRVERFADLDGLTRVVHPISNGSIAGLADNVHNVERALSLRTKERAKTHAKLEFYERKFAVPTDSAIVFHLDQIVTFIARQNTPIRDVIRRKLNKTFTRFAIDAYIPIHQRPFFYQKELYPLQNDRSMDIMLGNLNKFKLTAGLKSLFWDEPRLHREINATLEDNLEYELDTEDIALNKEFSDAYASAAAEIERQENVARSYNVY